MSTWPGSAGRPARRIGWGVALTLVLLAGACAAPSDPSAPTSTPSSSASSAAPSTPSPPTPTASSTASAPTSTGPAPTPPTSPRASPHTPSTSPATRPSASPSPTPPPGCGLPSALLGRDLTTVSTAKVVALTFDAGADDAGVDAILDTLHDTGTPATFFLTGRWVQAYPAQARRIADRHSVGNHTMTHPDLTTLSDGDARAQVDQAQAAILAATGQNPRPYFRFPYGAVTAHLIAVVNARCYVPFRWTVDSLGWKGTSGGMTVTSVRDRVVGAARPGAIVLMHVGANPDDGTTLDAAALPSVIAQLRAAGYRFVTLEAALPSAP